MASLPWVRMDTTLPTHDKILKLLSDPSAKRWQAAASYCFSIMWCGGAGTDGHVPGAALGAVHGTTVTARLLVKHGLWEENAAGWKVRNYEQRQPMALVVDAQRETERRGGRKGNCIRWHGPDCGCWKASGG